MTAPIISAKSRNEFREYYVGTTIRTIQEAFDGCGVRHDKEYQPPMSGQRRCLVEQYYHTVDWTNWKSVSRVVKVYEIELRELHSPIVSNSGAAIIAIQDPQRIGIANKLLYWLRLDGFEWVSGKLVRTASTPALDDLHDSAHKLEGTHLAQQIQRMRDAVETDPALAIGTAKELIETVCKTILEERGKPVEGTPDIPALTKALLKELQLVPEGVPEGRRGADTIKAILRSLGSICNDLAQLRGLYGTGHGKIAKTQALKPRHAKLAVGAAAIFVTFVFETHRALEVASPITSAGEESTATPAASS